MLRGDYSHHWYDNPPADARRAEGFLIRLEREARRLADWGSTPADVSDALTIEAFELAQIGDIAGAQHRLRLRDFPKWESVEACQGSYDMHMAEQRTAQQNGSLK